MFGVHSGGDVAWVERAVHLSALAVYLNEGNLSGRYLEVVDDVLSLIVHVTLSPSIYLRHVYDVTKTKGIKPTYG